MPSVPPARRRAALAALAAGLAGAGGRDARAQAAAAPAPPAAKPRRVVVIDSMRTPESVLHDAEQDVYFVSNIDGPSAAKDDNGFIARVRPDGRVERRRWAAGGQGGVTLHAPKGMALAGDTLWVADVDAVRGFDRRTGRPVRTADLAAQGARFLNDVAVGPDGALYVTDSGWSYDAYGVPVQGPSRVFRLAGAAVTVVSQDTLLAAPNGIAYDRAGGRLVVVSAGQGHVLALPANAAGGAPRRLATGPVGLDGVVALDDGALLVASQGTDAVHRFEAGGGGGAKVIEDVPSAGDIGWDARRRRVLVPQLARNRVLVYELPPTAPAASAPPGTSRD